MKSLVDRQTKPQVDNPWCYLLACLLNHLPPMDRKQKFCLIILPSQINAFLKNDSIWLQVSYFLVQQFLLFFGNSVAYIYKVRNILHREA
jgi:hypothetical protein